MVDQLGTTTQGQDVGGCFQFFYWTRLAFKLLLLF